MSTLDATTTFVRKLVAEWSGSSPVTVQHLPYGHNSISFDVTLPGARVIVRTHPDPNVFRWTLTISRSFAGSVCPSRACSSTTSNRERTIVDLYSALHRAALRASEAASLADSVLTGTSLLALTQSRLELARRVGSRHLRALDAIHLASAISLGDDLGAFCCYDRRLIADAEAAGLNVLSPGLD